MVRKAMFVSVGDFVRDANLKFHLCRSNANVETLQSARPGIVSGIECGGVLRRCCGGGLGNHSSHCEGCGRRAGDLAEERAARWALFWSIRGFLDIRASGFQIRSVGHAVSPN